MKHRLITPETLWQANSCHEYCYISSDDAVNIFTRYWGSYPVCKAYRMLGAFFSRPLYAFVVR